MNLRKLYYLLLIIPLLFINIGCDDETEPEEAINEAEVLVKYLEDNNDPVASFPKMVTASDVNANVLSGGSWAIIDIRGGTDYDNGHIEGAVNVDAGEVLDYYESNNLDAKEKVVIVCYSGQTAGWVNGLLWTVGKTNTFDLKWGMCSWNQATANAWKNGISNARRTELVTTATAKPAAGDLPKLETGKTAPEDILRARVEAVFAEGFTPAKVSNGDVFGNKSGYHIANYWSEADYSWGHIEGAMQYTPGTSLKLNAELKTLATDKPCAVYCYTGQTSAHVAAYLRVLGYDAQSILYGVNAMAHDEMPGTKFNEETEVHDYDLVQ